MLQFTSSSSSSSSFCCCCCLVPRVSPLSIYNIYYIFIAIAHRNPIVYNEYSSLAAFFALLRFVSLCFVLPHFHILFPHISFGVYFGALHMLIVLHSFLILNASRAELYGVSKMRKASLFFLLARFTYIHHFQWLCDLQTLIYYTLAHTHTLTDTKTVVFIIWLILTAGTCNLTFILFFINWTKTTRERKWEQTHICTQMWKMVQQIVSSKNPLMSGTK